MTQKQAAPAPKRKHLLTKIIVIVILILLLPVLALAGFLFVRWKTGKIDTFDKTSFVQQLPIPVVAPSTVREDGTRVFDLKLQQGQTAFFGEGQPKTNTWGVNGNYLGPTLRMKRGEKVEMQVHNTLPEMTSIHWHGMHLPAKMDGGPHQPIAPGGHWSPNWTVSQPAATLWYHPHPHGETRKHVYRGIAGMILIDDDVSAAAALPKTYGVDDIPVIVQDKKFNRNNQLNFGNDSASVGFIGNEILVNGARAPYVDVGTERVRLRLLNGSNARTYNFGLSNNEDMLLVATDGGLVEKPTALRRLELSPGERAEVVVHMHPNETVNLRSYPIDFNTSALEQRSDGGDDQFEIMQLRAKPTLQPSPTVPETLVSVERLEASADSQTRTLELLGNAINGRKMDMNRIDFGVTQDTVEAWRVRNGGDGPHNFHVHGVQFQVARLNGQPAPVHMQGWQDTIFLRSKDTAELLIRFSVPPDPEYPFMFHCHLLLHEDQGMMGQFVVLRRGDPVPTRLETSSHGH